MPKFLIIRDKDAAIETINIFKKNNIKALSLPLCEIEIFDIELSNLENISHIIFTSKNALKIANISFWQSINANIKFLVIGESFQEYLYNHNIKNIISFDTGKDLATYLKQGNIDNKILYLRAKEVSYDFAKEMPQHISEIICYEMIYKNIAAQEINSFIIENNISDILFFSYLSAQNYLNIMHKYLARQDNYGLYCLSENIAKIFLLKQYKKVYYPTRPTLESLIKIIKK